MVVFLGPVPKDSDLEAARTLARMHQYDQRADHKDFEMCSTAAHSQTSRWRVRKDQVTNIDAYRHKHVRHMLWLIKHQARPLPVVPLVEAAAMLQP